MLLYSPLFRSQFVYDDMVLIVKNQNLNHLATTLDYFRTATPFGSDFGSATSTYYRPLTWLSFALDRRVYGLNPAGFHSTNLLLHWINGLLALVCLRRVGASLPLATCSVALWLGLPINSEAVAWISARSYSLMFCFLLLALLAAERHLRKRGWLTLGAFFAASTAAAFSHETGVLVLPLAAILLGWRTRSKTDEWTWLASAGGVADALYFVSRYLAGGSAPGIRMFPPEIGLYFFKYLSWMLLPVHMSMERSTDTPEARLSTLAVLCVAMMLVLLAATVFVWRKLPAAAGGLLWMSVALLPLCGFVFVYQGMAERYSYVASAGLCFAVAALGLSSPQKFRKISLTLVALWALWGALRTHARAADWTEEEELFASSLKADPNSWVLWLNFGNSSLQSGRLGIAIASYRNALRIHPNAVKAMVNLASAVQLSGDKAGAEREYRGALALDPNRSDIYCDLAVVLFDEGRLNEAEHLLLIAIALDAANATAYFDLGVLYGRQGNPASAAEMYNKALALDPNYTDAQRALQQLSAR